MNEFLLDLVCGLVFFGAIALVVRAVIKANLKTSSILLKPTTETNACTKKYLDDLPKAVVNIPKLNKNAEKALEIAQKHGWRFLEYQEDNKMISFTNDKKERANFWYTTRTLGTCINHPTSGKTQLFRKKVTNAQLEKIFEDPRIHTGKGYHKKH